MKRLNFYILLFLFFGSLLSQTSIIWPTDASYVLTSTFGEYRPDHFHSGIDIKTWGREGFPVFAVGRGYISKIAISPYGYGKVLYLKLDNGMTAVFAHLSRFCDRIVPFVVEEQEKRKRYSIFISFPKNLIRVTKRDVIGYTGSTGIGYPHLHFELRDSLNRPVNPLLFLNSYVRDSKPPEISGIAVIPLSPYSRICGDVVPRIYRVEKVSNSLYTLTEPVIAQGRIGFSIRAYDSSETAQNKFSVFSYNLNVDGKDIFSVKYDTIPFQMTRFIDLDRNFWLRKNSYGLYNNLFNSYGKHLPVYNITNSDAGQIFCGEDHYSGHEFHSNVLENGEHFFLIRAEDFAGNFSEVSGKIIVGSNGNPSNFSFTSDSLRTGYHNSQISLKLSHQLIMTNLRFRLISSCAFENVPVLTVMVNAWDFRYVHLSKKSPVEYIGVLPLDDIKDSYLYCTASAVFHDSVYTVSDSADIFFVSQGRGGSMVSEDGACRISFSQGTFYTVCAASIESDAQTSDDFFLGKHYRILPDDQPLASRVVIQFSVPGIYSEERKVAIYRLSGEKISFVSNRFNKDILYGYISSLGTFTVLRDTTPPRILRVLPAEKEIIRKPVPVVSVKFIDDLSGIKGEDGYKIYIDDKRYIAEYDPEKDIAKALIRKSLKQGWHKLRIIITDRSGNKIEVNRNFFIAGRENER